MKVRAAAIHGALALVSLSAAYLTWQREPERVEGNAPIVMLEKQELQSVRFGTAESWVELFFQEVSGERQFWVRELKAPKAPPPPAGGLPDAGVPAVAETPETPAPKEKEFRASSDAPRVFGEFAPFYASRSLGQLSKDQLEAITKAYEPKRFLELGTTRGKLKFDVWFGPSAALTYVRPVDSERLFVTDAGSLQTFATRSDGLKERRLHNFAKAAYEKVVLKKAGKQVELTAAHDPGGEVKLSNKSAQKPNEFATNWHAKLLQMNATKQYAKGENPPTGEPQVELRVDYLKDGRDIGWIELGRLGGKVYARTELTSSWTEVGEPESFLQEVDRILGTT